MYRLNKMTKAWRNYLFANNGGTFNDSNNIISRVELISDSHEQILENVLSINKSEDVELACLEEIDFQLESLDDLIDEFIEYYATDVSNIDPEALKKDIVKELREKGTAGSMYIVANEWNDFVIGLELLVKSEKQVDLYNGVCKSIMDTFMGRMGEELTEEKT